MAGQLMERITELMKADVSDFLGLDLTEGENAIKEVDLLLVQLRAGLGERLALVHTKSKALAKLSDELATYASKAEFAVSSGRDDLARSALMRKLELSNQVGALRGELAVIDGETGKLEEAIAKLMAQRARILGAEDGANPVDHARQLAELDALFAASAAQKK